MPEPTEGAQGDPVAPTANPTPQPTPTDPTPAPSDSGSGDSSSPEKLKAALESERALRQQHERDAKAKAKELETLRAEKQAREDAEKTEAEKALARAEAAEKALADAEARNRAQAIRHAVASAARDQHFHDPGDAYALLDTSTVTVDESGEPQGVADLVKDLAKAKPHLVKTAAASGPPATPRSDRANGDQTPDEKAAIDRAFALHTKSRF